MQFSSSIKPKAKAQNP